jgi:hypothetical protein
VFVQISRDEEIRLMKRTLIALTIFAAFALTMTGRVTATDESAARRPEVLRKIYFSAVDAKGVQVTDLTAADLTVKEGGKERTIAEVRPANVPMHVSLFVDDAGTGAFQVAVAKFFEALLRQAKFAVSVMNPQPIKVADYTADPEELRNALGRLGQRGKVDVDGEQIVDAVGGAAKELLQLKAGRPVIVVLTASGEATVSNQSDNALNNLRASGASLHVLYVTNIELGKVLVEGPKQSGGMMQQVSRGVPIAPVLAKIADNLMNQYVLTYTIPDGVKLSDRLALTTSRKDVKLLAPTRLPDK